MLLLQVGALVLQQNQPANCKDHANMDSRELERREIGVEVDYNAECLQALKVSLSASCNVL